MLAIITSLHIHEELNQAQQQNSYHFIQCKLLIHILHWLARLWDVNTFLRALIFAGEIWTFNFLLLYNLPLCEWQVDISLIGDATLDNWN